MARHGHTESCITPISTEDMNRFKRGLLDTPLASFVAVRAHNAHFVLTKLQVQERSTWVDTPPS